MCSSNVQFDNSGLLSNEINVSFQFFLFPNEKTTKKNYLILFQFCFDVCQDLQTFIQGDLNHATSLYMPIEYKNKNLYTPNQRQHLSVG